MHKDTSSTPLTTEAAVTLPGSSSITLQAILLASLAEGASELSGMDLGLEVNALLHALQQLGLVIQLDAPSRSCVIAGGHGKFPKTQATVDCSNLQSSLYYLLMAVAASPGVYYFDGTVAPALPGMNALIQLMHQQGTQFIPNDCQQLPFTLIASHLKGGVMSLYAGTRPELLSALLLIAPYAHTPVTFTCEAETEKELELTCGLMADFGVLVQRPQPLQFTVSAAQCYQARDYRIEPDLATLFYQLTAAAIAGRKLTFSHFNRANSRQIDVKHLALFEKMGCVLVDNPEGLTLQAGTQVRGCDFSMQSISDHFFALAALALMADGPVCISFYNGIGARDHQLLSNMREALAQRGLRMEIGDTWLRIYPGKPRQHADVSEIDTRLQPLSRLIDTLVS